MLRSTDYQRYKQKLERLQNKVKKSEAARKELEIKFQRLMKERNECEKAATIHKSKCASLLEQERRRMNRNEKLLHMLEEVDAKAAALATKTERLKILKTQQEYALMNSWRRNNYLHQQQSIFSNAQIPNDGILSILKCTQPIDYSGPFADPNANERYGIPFKNDFTNCINSIQQPPFESNVRNSNEAEKFIKNTINQQQTSANQNHLKQYSSSLMPFYHCNKDQRQFLVQQANFESPQPSNQYGPPLPSLSTQQTYGAGYPVPVTNRPDSTTLSLSTLSSYQLPMKIEHNAYYPNLNQQNILNSSLIDVGTNRNESTLSIIPVNKNFVASTAPSITTSKLPSDETISNICHQRENTRSNSNEKALHFDDGSQTYSFIRNKYQPRAIHYQGQPSQFSTMPGMATILPMENSQKTIEVITTATQPTTNLISQMPLTSAPMNVMAIIQPNTTHNQTTHNNIHTNIDSGGSKKNENENENYVLSASNIVRDDKNDENDKNNNARDDNQRWPNKVVNDGYVYENQLADCKISETFTNPINVKMSVVNSSFGIIPQNMNKNGTEMTLTKQTTQPLYSHSVNRMEKNDNYQYNEFADYASRECHSTATPSTPAYESHFKDKLANETNNRVHISNVDIAPSALFTRRLEEKRRSSIDSAIPFEVCDVDVLLPQKSIATNNVRRRYSVASDLHIINLPQNFGSPETFYLSNALSRENAELYHRQGGKDGNSNSNNGNDDDDVIDPNSDSGNRNKYENGNSNMFTTSLDTRRIIEPTTKLNLKQLNSAQNANLWQNDEIIKSNDQRSSVASSVTEVVPPPQLPLDMINSQTLDMPAFISDDDDVANQNQTTDINQSNVYTVEHDNMQQSRPFATNQVSDEQTFIENTMEQLKLENDIEDEQRIDQFNPIRIVDGNEKIRSSTSHSKTVTWADDPHNNYKKDDAQQQFHDSANDDDDKQNNINNASFKHIYTDEANQLQQYQQNRYIAQAQYQLTDNYVDNVETTNPANSCEYQYDQNQNLYQNQVDASDQNVYENRGYYYTDSDQYGIDQQIQPEPQGLQHAFYEQSSGENMSDTITNDGNRMISATEQLSDGYQQYPVTIDLMSQVQPQQDAYYSVTPGENFYTVYTDADQNQQYFLEVDADQKQHQQEQEQQPQQQPQIESTTNVGQTNDERIPNYLQSDTDDSQITHGNQNAQYQ